MSRQSAHTPTLTRVRRRASRPTVAYAPCCPRDVYSGIVGASGSPDALSNLCLVGTSLSSQAASQSLVAALERGTGGAAGAGGSGGGLAGPVGAFDGGGRELHSLLHSRGAAVEALLPDVGGTHGVATAVHLFPRMRLLRSGLFR
jgi:hypothetical protein